MLHLALVVWVFMCLAAAWWQVDEAILGNSLSYLYAIEWPSFAVLGFFGWYSLLNMEKITEHQEKARKEYEEKMRAEAQIARQVDDDPEDPAMKAYNDHSGGDRDSSEEAPLGSLVETAFRRYRIMSFVTGTTLLILFVTLFLHRVDFTFWKHIKIFVDVVGIGHGIVLYPLYMIMCFNMVLEVPPQPGAALAHALRRLRAGARVLSRVPHAPSPLPERTPREMTNPGLNVESSPLRTRAVPSRDRPRRSSPLNAPSASARPPLNSTSTRRPIATLWSVTTRPWIERRTITAQSAELTLAQLREMDNAYWWIEGATVHRANVTRSTWSAVARRRIERSASSRSKRWPSGSPVCYSISTSNGPTPTSSPTRSYWRTNFVDSIGSVR
jgi:hypothetical protein